MIGTPSPTAEFYAEACEGDYTGRTAWIEPGDPMPAAPPSPEVLAEIVRVRLEGSLPAPEVATDPGAGVAAIVGFPTFVSVTNWSGVVTDRECDPTGLLCVTVTATPSMVWSPGEPDAAVLSCAGPGVRFDPAGAEAEVQASAPEACAYAYERRTGVEGRPREWPGEVAVRWGLVWSSTGAGGGGVLDPVVKSTSVPRAVSEVQAVVVSGES